jgi:hypothetical protein
MIISSITLLSIQFSLQYSFSILTICSSAFVHTSFVIFSESLKNPSLAVLDNASYHNVKTEDTMCPNFSQKKAVFQNYLIQNNIPFSATDTNKVLYEKILKKDKTIHLLVIVTIL